MAENKHCVSKDNVVICSAECCLPAGGRFTLIAPVVRIDSTFLLLQIYPWKLSSIRIIPEDVCFCWSFPNDTDDYLKEELSRMFHRGILSVKCVFWTKIQILLQETSLQLIWCFIRGPQPLLISLPKINSKGHNERRLSGELFIQFTLSGLTIVV